MTVPAKMVAETLEIAREDGAAIRRKPNEIFDSTIVDNLEKSGFMKELWGGEAPTGRQKVVAKRRSCLLCFVPIRSRNTKGGVFSVDLTSEFTKQHSCIENVTASRIA